MSNNKLSPIIVIITTLAILSIAFYDIFRTKGLRVSTILFLVVYLIWIFKSNYPVFVARLKGKGFLYKDGVKGTVVRGPYPIQSSRVAYDVAVNLMYLSKHRKKEALGSFYKFYQYFTHHAVVKEIGVEGDFIEFPGESCSDPKGCILYSGTVNQSRPIFNEAEAIRKRLKEKEFTIARMETNVASIMNQLKVIADDKNQTFSEVSDKLKGLVSDIHVTKESGGEPHGTKE